ncbi:class I adenylate-forming enzyme family protein [Eggerthella sinensis]|uniref:class I adenylate-forming enzyme family protein n=1 Tax=Eggerthella sinensis TaxID=242230 RepID=UPI001D0710F7|nr:AMP-binding protein [Eggerthella sinensis]MCB7037754.1 AMP-binding protein [Eggerthella sinensis]
MNDAVQRFFYRVQQTPEREAVYDSAAGRRYTYGELGDRARRLAAYLVDEQGLAPGDVVGLAAENCTAFVDAFYASCLTGIVITTYNCRLRAVDLVPLVEREQPRVVFASERHRAAMEACVRMARAACVLVSIDGDVARDGRSAYERIVDGGADASRTADGSARFAARGGFGFEDPQMLVHTGGTTGLPKSAVLSFRAVFYNAMSELLTTGMTAADCGVVFLPFFHTAGWNSAVLPLLLAGGRIVLTDTLEPGVLLRLIEQERPTVGIAIEAIYLRLASHPAFATTDLSSYERLTNGASAISESTMMAYWERGIKILNAYGMTETGPNNCYPPANDLSLDDVRAHWGTVGKPMYFNELRIVDEDGREVAAGEDGELWWRGPVTFSGYWKDPAATAEVLDEDGWVHSGDIGHRDAEGYVHLQGRKKNMLICNGENVFPIEIENALKAHPSVEDCRVLGVPDGARGEVPKALVLLREGAAFDRDALERFARARLASIKVPRYYVALDDFPRCGMKVSLEALRAAHGFAGE